jgi:hypothetical protein
MAANREAWRLVHAATVELRYYAKYESLRQHLEASHAGRAAQRAVYWVQSVAAEQRHQLSAGAAVPTEPAALQLQQPSIVDSRPLWTTIVAYCFLGIAFFLLRVVLGGRV